MGPFKGWPDILVIVVPSVFAFNLQCVCVFFSFVYLTFHFCSLLKNIFLAKMMGINI